MSEQKYLLLRAVIAKDNKYIYEFDKDVYQKREIFIFNTAKIGLEMGLYYTIANGLWFKFQKTFFKTKQ